MREREREREIGHKREIIEDPYSQDNFITSNDSSNNFPIETKKIDKQ